MHVPARAQPVRPPLGKATGCAEAQLQPEYCTYSLQPSTQAAITLQALSGAHTLGRAKKTRSGFGADVTKYTQNGPGKPGGSSWTPEWLKFDNSYFTVRFCWPA